MCKRLLGLLLFATAFAFAQGRVIQVDVTYTGSGTVDAGHKMYVALWDNADLTAGPPADVKPIDSKTGSVKFTAVKKVPAYVTVAYDPTGKWQADSPPPTGSSLGMYSTDPPKPAPIEVEPAKSVTVKITFDDTHKVP